MATATQWAKAFVKDFVQHEDFKQSEESRKRRKEFVDRCYAKLAELFGVQEGQLEEKHFAAIIAAVQDETDSMSEEQRCKILAMILAEDILRAPVEETHKFLEGDAWLSKHLIVAIAPQYAKWIFDIALRDHTVLKKYDQLCHFDSTSIQTCEDARNVRRQNVDRHLDRIFPRSSEADEDSRRHLGVIGVDACFFGILAVAIGATVVPSFGLSLVIVIVGAALIAMGGGMIIKACGFKSGFFSSSKKDDGGEEKSQQRFYDCFSS